MIVGRTGRIKFHMRRYRNVIFAATGGIDVNASSCFSHRLPCIPIALHQDRGTAAEPAAQE